jgi:hypothetical protein
MKLLIAGSRHIILEPDYIELTLSTFGIIHDVEEIVSGGNGGVDWAGEEFCLEYLNDEATVFPADWTQGHLAGPARNKKMAEYADAMLIIWDGKSPGSANMKSQMLAAKKPIYEVVLKGPT